MERIRDTTIPMKINITIIVIRREVKIQKDLMREEAMKTEVEAEKEAQVFVAVEIDPEMEAREEENLSIAKIVMIAERNIYTSTTRILTPMLKN